MIDAATICNWLNGHLSERPSFIIPVLRTQWAMDLGDAPEDIDYYTQSTGLCAADFLGLINGILIPTGQMIVSVNIQDTIQFIVTERT